MEGQDSSSICAGAAAPSLAKRSLLNTTNYVGSSTDQELVPSCPVSMFPFLRFASEIERDRHRFTYLLVLLVMAMLFPCVWAKGNHTVRWAPDPDVHLNLWSASTSFLVNDYLIFTHDSNHNVVEVHKSHYINCSMSRPIAVYNNDGETIIFLDHPGRRYFICGQNDFCVKGMKMTIEVVKRLHRPHHSSPRGSPLLSSSLPTSLKPGRPSMKQNSNSVPIVPKGGHRNVVSLVLCWIVIGVIFALFHSPVLRCCCWMLRRVRR